jgi:hypothetical protein
MKNKNQRHQEAEVRLSEYKKLTTVQKLLKLDLKLWWWFGCYQAKGQISPNSLKKRRICQFQLMLQ